MNETQQDQRRETTTLPNLSDVTGEQEAPEGMDGSTIRLDRLPHLTGSLGKDKDAAGEEEPQSEEPGQYIPPVRKIPHSHTRTKEMKQKLAAGPERRYYQLFTQGIGRLRLILALTALLVVLSAVAAGLYAFGVVGADRMRLMVFGQVFIMLVAALLGYNQLLEGLSDLFVQGRFTLNTLLCATFVSCCCDAVYCLQEQRVPLCAAFALEMVMSIWAANHRRVTEMGQMDTLRKAVRLEGLYRVEELYNMKPGIIRDQGRVEDFMEHYREISPPEQRQNRYALISLFVSLGISVVAGVCHGVTMALLMLSTALLVAVPASFFVAMTRPAAVLERRLHRMGTVICGWRGVKAMTGKIVVPLCDHDMFPRGTTKMNGVKFYGDRDPEEIIAYGAALFRAVGGGLAPLFEDLLLSRNGPKYEAESVRQYHGGGVGGEVCGEPVLVGTLKFLKDMGVEVPPGTKVQQAVHLSIDGQLAGLFAINYNRSKYSAAGLATLGSDRDITAVITAGDFMLNDRFLQTKFGIHPKRVAFPDMRRRVAMNQAVPLEGDTAVALVTREGLAPAAYAITGARAYHTACRLGMAIHMTGGILGMIIMLVLAVLGAVELLTPVNILLYQLIWMVPGLLVTAWPKTI